MGGTDADSFDGGILDQLARVGEGAHAVALGKGASEKRVRVTDRFESRAGVGCQRGGMG